MSSSAASTRLTVGLVGCGRIARRHAAILRDRADVHLAAVADTTAARADAFAREYGARAYTGLAALIEREKPDLVTICTPSGNHAEQVLLASRAGVKSVIVEKPMALRLSDADAMIAECERRGTLLMVVKQNRYNLPIKKLREAMDHGRFGKLVLGAVRVRWCRRQDYYDQDAWRGKWASDGGVFSNQASHHVDMLVHLLGDVASVRAVTSTRLVRIEAEDTGVALLTFRSGALGVIEATTAARPEDLEGSISILGENGTVEVGGFAMNEMKVWRFSNQGPEDEGVLDRYRTNPPDVYGFGHHEFLDHAINAIRTGAPAPVDGREGRRSLEVITAIYESSEAGTDVRLPFTPRRSRLGEVR
ncbi:MAG TPA: Gfo/Idh/MocA family oxidoreductase [Thermoanaerobaculia bacterium]|nr:Gfo/Idh/MocA family oxidoreductase [Thermoanaerobaculia bacterium]